MAEAEVKLTSALNEEGGRERLNVENLNDEQEQVVLDIDLSSSTLSSMRFRWWRWTLLWWGTRRKRRKAPGPVTVKLIQHLLLGWDLIFSKRNDMRAECFSENSFTSDTDVSSSSSCSSSSSEDGDSREKKEPQGTKDTSEDSQRKRPLIEELPSPPRAKTPRQS